MQEMLEWVRATLPMDLDTSRLIEEKVISMLEKEKEVIIDAHIDGQCDETDGYPIEIVEEYHNQTIEIAEEYYNQTFNTKRNE